MTDPAILPGVTDARAVVGDGVAEGILGCAGDHRSPRLGPAARLPDLPCPPPGRAQDFRSQDGSRRERLATPGAVDAGMRDLLLAAVPALRAFAYALTHDRDRSDDLVQDTLLRAWTGSDGFRRGTNLTAWLFTILRNQFRSEQRRRKREVEDADGAIAAGLASLPEQEVRVGMREFREALALLPATQREALLLIGAQSLTYAEAAGICGVAVGTIKSRVSRARGCLIETLGMDGYHDIGADALTRAALGRP